MSSINEFIHNNAKWLLILLFTAGITYSRFQHLEGAEERAKQNLIVVEERLNKKIKIIAENEDRIHELEKRIIVLETNKCQ